MGFTKTLLPIFLYFTIFVSAQVDTVKSKISDPKSKTIQNLNSNENSYEIKSQKNKSDNVTSGNLLENTVVNSEILKNKIKSQTEETINLKNKIEKLENENRQQLKQLDNIELLFKFLIGFYILTVGITIYIIRRDNVKREVKLLEKLKKKDKHSVTSIDLIPKVKAEINHSFETKSFTNLSGISKNKFVKNNDWFLVAASAIGKSHLVRNIPCQDNHYCEVLENGWGIAISCDGAGSEDNSHLGSEFIAKQAAIKVFKECVIQNRWINNNCLPSDNDWKQISYDCFKQIRNELEKFANARNIKFASVASTIIVLIYSPIGLAVSHIGDGRAGFCTEKGDWKSIITPHKGEEANQTIFITSNAWINDSNFVMSDIPIPESRVISEKPIAFFIMSDGCETHSFECSKMDIKTNMWSDPNLPYPKFFNPLTARLKEFHENNISSDNANKLWRQFIEEGNPGLKNETDDKTLVLGILT